MINEIQYADNLVLISESKKNLKEKFLTWDKAFEGKELKVNLKKTKVMARVISTVRKGLFVKDML